MKKQVNTFEHSPHREVGVRVTEGGNPHLAMVAGGVCVRRRAFTIIEMLVVVSIIALIIAILMPMLGNARETAQIATCLSNQQQIVNASTNCALDFDHEFIPARRNSVQIALDTPQLELFISYDFPWERWFDPGRDYSATYEPAYSDQLVLGYQYFGGITQWTTARGAFKTASPVAMEQAQPGYAMSACTIFKIDGEWGGGRETAYKDMPSHSGNEQRPTGGNQSFVDGSAYWIDFQDMTYNHTWNTGGSRKAYWYQDDLGPYGEVAIEAAY